MCRCAKPTRNDESSLYGVNDRAPDLQENDELIYDEPGRCRPQVNGTGSTDYHSHHFRLVNNFSNAYLLVRHGAGDERVSLGGKHRRVVDLLRPMESDSRYLMLYALYLAHSESARAAREIEAAEWRAAAAEKRIKTRKLPGQNLVKVWIEPAHAKEA